MTISEEQMKERLSSSQNLANRFRNGRIYEGLAIQRPNEESLNERSTQENPNQIEHREIKRPGNNRPWLSREERTRIAADLTAATGDYDEKQPTQTEIAKKYGVQVSTVSDIINNKRRVEDSPRSVDQEKIDAILEGVQTKAVDRLKSGLSLLTDDKIAISTARDISVICANMAKVVQQTLPQEKTTQQINLVVYTPELKAEKTFDIIEVG